MMNLKKQDYRRRLDLVPILYSEGKPQLYIEQTLKLTRKTIRGILKADPEVKYKTKSEQWLVRYGSTLDETCFDELTPEALYWIGLLYADGHIAKNREYSISLTLHTNDIDHLEKYKKFLKTNKNVSKDNGECYRLRINSEKVHKRLQELGFKHDKSYTAVPHHLLKDSRDFWRGVVDGDGGVYNNRKDTPQLFMCGTLETVFEFIIFCSKFAFIKDKYPSKCVGKNLYQVSYYGKDAIKTSALLYENSEVYLQRKFDNYLEIQTR